MANHTCKYEMLYYKQYRVKLHDLLQNTHAVTQENV